MYKENINIDKYIDDWQIDIYEDKNFLEYALNIPYRGGEETNQLTCITRRNWNIALLFYTFWRLLDWIDAETPLSSVPYH